MKQARSIFHFLRDGSRRGERTVLVTLTEVTGSATRAPGEHMAVAESGAVMGSFSGGCVESAVIAEAQEVLAAGRPRQVRYGAGSPYIDIRLPCGGGIDLLFLPDPDYSQIALALDILERRRPLKLQLSSTCPFAASEAAEVDRTGWTGHDFLARHDPQLQLVVLGHGAEPGALLQMAEAYGAETLLFSPQASLVEEARARGTPAHLLRIVGRGDCFVLDPWSAAVTLFHDHDWETDLLLQALEQQPLFIGAMGSRRTHIERRNRLLEAGADPLAIDRIVGPVGLIAATRDPQTLAVSILAQVVQVYENVLARKVVDRPPELALNAAHRFDEHSAWGAPHLEALHKTSGNAATQSTLTETQSEEEETRSMAGISKIELSRRGLLAGSAATAAIVASPITSEAAPLPPSPTSASLPVSFEVNGAKRELKLDPRTTLLDALREHLHLTGTKKGCDHGQCGACTVMVDGVRINSCLSLAVMHEGDKITTIEGLGTPEKLHPMQAAFVKHDGYQCGYCTPGQICSAVAVLDEIKRGVPSHVQADLTVRPQATNIEMRERMSGNICRCGAYSNIAEAMAEVAGAKA